MSEPDRQPPRPEGRQAEEGSSDADMGLRSDLGASQQRPREEDAAPTERIEESGQRGPAGSGQVPGRGKLGSNTPTDKGAEQGPR